MKTVLSKIGYALFILFSIATLVFFLFSFSFPDPEQMVVGERTDAATKLRIRQEMGLDKPISEQYLMYINDLSPLGFTNDETTSPHWVIFPIGNRQISLKWPELRRSFQTGKKVTEIIGSALLGTFVLALSSMALATVAGLIFGIISALHYNRWPDRLFMMISTAGISLPSFFAAIIIAWLLGYVLHDVTGLTMTGSLFDYDPFEGRKLMLQNLILPTLALGIRPLAVITQLTRSSLLEELGKDYIRTAYAKGLPAKHVIYKHALRNAINPVVTSLSGWFASLLAGAFFVEYIFNWKGLGKITIEALEKSDLPLVMGSVLLVASLFIIINLWVDMVYRWIDPRIKEA
jgi:peptide/nickel transport system permease protein